MENQSLENLKNQINLNQISQEKRGRGRPKKTINPNPQTNHYQNHQTNHQPNQPTYNVNNGELIPAFKSLYEFGDNVLADNYKDNSLKSDNAQIEFMARNSNDVVYDFFPTINSKYIKLIMLVITLIAVYGKKFIIIKNKEEAKEKKDIKPEPKDLNKDVIPVKQDVSPFPINPNKMF